MSHRVRYVLPPARMSYVPVAYRRFFFLRSWHELPFGRLAAMRLFWHHTCEWHPPELRQSLWLLERYEMCEPLRPSL
jgi:hypothetical protein